MARLLRALATKDRNMITQLLQPQDIESESQMIFRMASVSVFAALKQGKLLLLSSQESKGMVKMVRSRIGQARLAQLLGNADFPVVISSELLARRITVQAHKEDHGLTTGCRKSRKKVGLHS